MQRNEETRTGWFTKARVMSVTDELMRLDRLREGGALSADDFMCAMAKLLVGCPTALPQRAVAAARPSRWWPLAGHAGASAQVQPLRRRLAGLG